MRISCVQVSMLLFFVWITFSFFSLSCLAGLPPKTWNLSEDNLLFVGRQEYLEAIHSFFKKDDRRMLLLTGGPGFGKSEIAKKYAQTFMGDYDLIWWFDSQQGLPSQFEKLANALNTLLPAQEQIISSKISKDVLVDSIKNVLRVKSIKYLFIFDNAEEYAQIEKFIPYAHQKFRKNILLTSRNPNLWIDKIEVGKFKRQESLQFIKLVLPQEKGNDVNDLAEAFSDYPLGLKIATGIIKPLPTLTIPKYLAIHKDKAFINRAKNQNIKFDTYANDAETALRISLKTIEEGHKDALQALFFMSLLNSKDIPESYIDLWLKKIESPLIAAEAIKYIYNQSLVGVSDTTEFQKGAKREESQPTHYLSILDQIHQLINELLLPNEKKKLLETATAVLLDVLAGPSEVFTKKIMHEPIHLLHARKLCANAEKIGYSSSKLLQLKVCIFEFIIGALRDFAEGTVMLIQIEKDLDSGIQLEPYYKGLFNVNKGFIEAAYHVNYDDAIRSMSEGLTLIPSTKEYNAEKLRIISNIAQYHGLRGEISIANQWIDKWKSIFEQSNSIVHNTLFVFASGAILHDQGKFEEAIALLRKAKNYPNLSVDYPTLYHVILRKMIEILVKQYHLKEAQKVLDEYEDLLKKFFQDRYEKSFDSANVLFFKSLISIYTEKNDGATIKYLSEGRQIYREAFKADKKHRQQARVHLMLGKAYQLEKAFKAALKEYLLSEEIYDIVMKEKQIDDISELYAALVTLGPHLKDEGLTQKYLTTHIETFGLDHPRTEKILKHLDQSNLGI